MPKYRLTYLDIRGNGEPIRLMLSYMGKEFEDHRVSWEEWSKIKNDSPFGKMPILEIDGRVIHQLRAILKYLAHEAGLAGNNAEENLEIDMVAGAFGDLALEFTRHALTQNPNEKEKLKEILINETIPFYMSKFETILKNNGGYLANGKLSWVEFYVVGFSSSIPGVINVNIMEKYPFFNDLVERVHSLPGVKEWVKKRPDAPI